MITGAFNSFAVSKTPLIVDDPVTFTAGSANFLSFANRKISCTSSPVATPGFIL